MKTKLLMFVALLLMGFCSNAQTQFWSDGFEDTGSPSVGTRTPSIAEFNCTTGSGPNKGYFKRTNGTDVVSDGGFTNLQGTKFWGFLNLDIGTTCTSTSIVAAENITWSGINIAGKTGLTFKGLFGGNTGGGFQGLQFANAGQGYRMDSMAVEYRIDGGAWVKLIGIYPTDGATLGNSPLAQDNDNNRIGDGTTLTSALLELSGAITGTGSLLDLRFDIFDDNSSPGSMAIDNFRLFAADACTPPSVTANQPNRTLCAAGSTTLPMTAAGTGLTYQWQANTGSSFNNITNGGVYSNATTATLNITGVTAGMNGYTYRCVVTGTCGTANSDASTLTVSSPSGSTVKTNVSCNGLANGTATVTPSGGISPYTYSWAPSGGTAATASGLGANTYTVTITDNIGCTGTATANVTQPTVLGGSISSQTNIACNGTATGTTTVSATGGTPSYSYAWAPSGGTAATASGLGAGTYTVTITDANSCTKTVNTTISQPTNALAASITAQTNIACNGSSTGSTTVTATGGTPSYNYSWAPSGGTAATASGLAANTYTVTVTDGNGCIKTVNTTIAQPNALVITPTQTNISCNGATNGTATATVTGGTGPYTYSWAPSGGTAATASGLGVNTYTVTVTDANLCTKTQTYSITTPSVISHSIVSTTNVGCNGASTGASTITASGGTGTLAYSWAPSGGTAATATGLSAGTYTVTITDGNNCNVTQNVTVTQPGVISHSIVSTTNVGCNGASTGASTITASGGTGTLAYSWAPSGGTAATATGLSAGTYTVTITDGNNCNVTQNVTVTQPGVISHSIGTTTNVGCNGASTGASTITASGGTGTLTYSWAPSGGTAATATGLSAGTYTVTIHDGNGCSATQNVTVTQPGAITHSIVSTTNVGCNGASTGASTITASGGTGPLAYSWAPSGGTAATATGLSAGTYTVTITDGNNCNVTQNVTVTQPGVITHSIVSTTNVGCNGASTGASTITASGGTGTLAYSWAPSGGTAATATGLSAGTYTVTITDGNNCNVTQNVTVTQPGVITHSIVSTTNVGCNGASTGASTITASGGTGPLAYSWAPSGGTAATATGLSAGTYTVTITDGNNCNVTQNVTVTQPGVITHSIASTTNVGCNGASTGASTITASGGTGPLAYSWAPSGGTAATATGLSAGTYTVTITDGNNCNVTQNVTVTQPGVITHSIVSTTNVGCNGASTGASTITASGGTGTLAYSWAPTGGTAATATGLSAGTYTVTITDGNNCNVTQNVTVTQPGVISHSVASTTNVGCIGASTGASTITASGGTGTLTYSWAPTGGTAATATGLSAGTYTVTIHDGNGCSATQNTTVTQPLTAVQVVAINDTNSCSGSNVTLGATASGGTPGYNYVWTPGNLTGANPVVNPTTTTSYIVTASDANGCTKKDTVVVSVGGVLAQANQTNSVSIDGADTSTSNVLIGNLNFCYNEDCKIIASVKNNAALGAITAFVTVEDTVPTYNGRPYLPRWYKITPTNNIAASVNLYFTQQDFNDYNAYAGTHGYPLLPQSPTDQAGIDTLVVSKVSGGDINSGSGVFTLIHPDSVKWNAALHFWTVSLQVPSFSEFFVHAGNSTNTPLIVSLSSFTAKKEKSTVGLYWTTLSETDNVGFTIERSNDGKSFNAIGNVNSLAKNGNSNAQLDYVYTDKTPMIGMNFYRLAEINKAGVKVYSDVRSVNFDNQSVFNCYPNPTTGQIAIEHNSDIDGALTVRLTDVLGKVVLETKMPVTKGFNKTQVNVSSLAQGMYNMSIVDASGILFNTRITKQ